MNGVIDREFSVINVNRSTRMKGGLKSIKASRFSLISIGLLLFLGAPALSLSDESLPSQASQGQASDPFPEPYLYGKAVLAHGATLSGATISVLNARGTDVTDLVLEPAGPDFCKPRGRRCTSESGSFAFKIKGKFPSRFRIVAKGGTINGKKTNITLEQWVDDNSSLKHGANLTIGSTVFAKLVKKGLSSDVALIRTKKTLHLPFWANFGIHLHHSSTYLSGLNLVESAPSHGGYKYSMQQLIAAARWGRESPWIRDSLPVKTKAAPPAPSLELDSLPEWATNILKGVPGSIVGSIVGAGVNWVIGAIGLNPTTNSLERIEADLSDISTQLASIQSVINNLVNEVNQDFQSLKLLEQCNNDRQAATTYWNNLENISGEILFYTESLQQLTDYGAGKESLATAKTAWRNLNKTGDVLSSGVGINSLINGLTGLNSPPGQTGFISNVVAAFSSCTQQKGKVFLNPGERAAYASTFDWGMALMLTASMVQHNYNIAGTWKCMVAPPGTLGGSDSLFCDTGMLAFPSDVAAGTNAPSPTPSDIYYAFNNAYPQIMPSGVSADLRSGLLWTRVPVKPDVMIDADGLVKNISIFPVKVNSSTELPINSMTQWRLPSLSVAQGLIGSVPSGTIAADWLNSNTQAIAGETTFDSVVGNLNSQRAYVDSVLGSPDGSTPEPSNSADLAAPWGSLVYAVPLGSSYMAYSIIPSNTRAYGIITTSSVNANTCLSSESMFGNQNDITDQATAYCTVRPTSGFGPNPAGLKPATSKDSYQLVMLDQSAKSFDPNWINSFPFSFFSLLNCQSGCLYGAYQTFVLRDSSSLISSSTIYNDANDIIIHGYSLPKDYSGHYITALTHTQSKDKVFSRDTKGNDGSVVKLMHAPSFTVIPDDWALNTAP